MADAQDIDDRLKQMRAMHLMVEGIGAVSVAQLADLGATVAQRYLTRSDEAAREPPPEEPALAPPISADTDERDELDEAVATAEQRLAAAETAQQHDDLAATLERIERRTTELDERTASISEAIAAGDVQRLAELMDDDLGET